MDMTDLLHRCDQRRRNHVRFVSSVPAVLKGYRLVSNVFSRDRQSGILNIVPDPKGTVHGVVHELPAGDALSARDLAEGEPHTFRLVTATVTTARGKDVPASVLVASVKTKSIFRPSDSYMQLVIKAAKEHGLPSSWIEKLESLQTVPEGTSARTASRK